MAAAITLAANSLATEDVAGTILIVADALDGVDAAAVRQSAGRSSLLILSIVPPGAEDGVASALRPDVVHVSVDGADIRTLERRIETRFQAAQTDRYGAQWQDEGYWMLLPAGLLCLLWFRRGTTVAWIILLFLMLHAAPADAQTASRFRNLWLTPDQQGRLAFDRGDYRAAAKLFADPMWRGIAAYRAFDFLTAAQEFEHVGTTEAASRSATPRRKTTPTRRPQGL